MVQLASLPVDGRSPSWVSLSGKIVEVDVLADPDRLGRLDLGRLSKR
jgi:hypothetical protein